MFALPSAVSNHPLLSMTKENAVEYSCSMQQPSFSIYPFTLLAISPSFVKSAVAAGREPAQNVLPGVSISCQEERKRWLQLSRISERGKGNEQNSWKASWRWPLNICHSNRRSLFCDIGFLVYYCFAKRGRCSVLKFQQFLMSVQVHCFRWKYRKRLLTSDCSLWDSGNNMQFMPFACLMHEQRTKSNLILQAILWGGHGAVMLPYCSLGNRNRQNW